MPSITPTGNAIERIYAQLNNVFGSTDPSQFFCLMNPGTTLDAQAYVYDPRGIKPGTVAEAESRLVDQLFDVAPVVGSANGQRVSQQYLQSLSVLVPRFNQMMPVLKNAIRDFLNAPVAANTMLDGIPFVGTLQEYYFALYDRWIQKKLAWDADQQAQKDKFAVDPATAKEKFLDWYELTAEARLAELDAAMGEVLSIFSPSDMNAMFGALAAGAAGQVDEATNIVKDIRLMSPSGGYIYPVDLTPDDWFLDLSSDIDPVDLLKDPEFIAADITTKRQALASSIAQVQALLASVPTPAAMQAAVDAMTKAQTTYVDAQNKILGVYTDNSAIAVEMYLSKHANDVSPPSDAQAQSELNTNATAASKAKGEQPPAAGVLKKASPGFTSDDVQKIVAGQKNLIAAQSALITSAQSLADAGVSLASAQSQSFGTLPLLLARLQAQLGDITTRQQQLAASIAAGGTPARTPLAKIYLPETQAAVPGIVKAANVAAATNQAVGQTVVDAVTAEIAKAPAAAQAELAALQTAATTARDVPVTAASVAVAVRAASDKLAASGVAVDVATAAAGVAAAGETAAAQAGANAAAVTAAVTAAINAAAAGIQPALEPLDQAATAAAAVVTSAADVAAAVAARGDEIVRAPKAAASAAAQRFMDVQLSFSRDDMSTSSSTNTQFSQTSWGVDLFFGSVGGSSSSVSSVSAANSMEANTAIEVGFKVAKVDISREWFDPGIFKLSRDMNRLSTAPISLGRLPRPAAGSADASTNAVDWKAVNTKDANGVLFNDCLLPCFPVAFVIAKDVTMRFQATASALSAIKSVVDSKSAIGGGFLCFSASASSSSHGESQAMSSTTEGTTMTIHMPGPQILGWFLETPVADGSTQLSINPTQTSGDLNIDIIKFINQLHTVAANAPAPAARPAIAPAVAEVIARARG